MQTILITGAAGNIGGELRRQFTGKFKLRLSDKQPLAPFVGETLGDQSVLFGFGLGAALAILGFGFETTNRNAWRPRTETRWRPSRWAISTAPLVHRPNTKSLSV
jgi:hypothetical protein